MLHCFQPIISSQKDTIALLNALRFSLPNQISKIPGSLVDIITFDSLNKINIIVLSFIFNFLTS